MTITLLDLLSGAGILCGLACTFLSLIMLMHSHTAEQKRAGFIIMFLSIFIFTGFTIMWFVGG